MKRRTKIVCTLGPAVDSKEKIKALIDAGMNVARLNCSHGDWVAKKQWIEWIRELSPTHSPVAILADLQGPKFRVGMIPGGSMDLISGSVVSIGIDAQIPIDQKEILDAMTPNTRMLLGDGEIEIKVLSKEGSWFQGKVVTGGALKSKKGVTLVGKVFNVPALSEKDIEDVAEAHANKVDFIALSYVKTAGDIRDLRRVMDKLGATQHVCAKIETREAIKELNEIIKVVDIIMVARGDMGLQMDIEDVPVAQKHIIQVCGEAGIPVITATQMLESMISNPRPTRAEASDVFNAIIDGTDAVMLSGETAAGQYPIECVKTMGRIAESAEGLTHREHMASFPPKVDTHTDAVVLAVSQLEKELKPKAIVTTSTSGQTPRLISKFKPKAPILCATWNTRTLAYMAVVWGVESVQVPGGLDTDENLYNTIEAFTKLKRLKIGDQYIFTAGVPAGKAGNTNMIMTQVVK